MNFDDIITGMIRVQKEAIDRGDFSGNSAATYLNGISDALEAQTKKEESLTLRLVK